MRKVILALIAMLFPVTTISAGQVKIKIEKQYLNFPVCQGIDGGNMKISGNGVDEWPFHIKLADGTTDYWVFRDVSGYKGKTLTITFDGDRQGLGQIYQDDKIAGADDLYRETNRPQVHFTPKVGWHNDPNGMLYYDGEYHLFFQHNPYEREWNNMHWGHAVSRDLIHWEELPEALFPDSLGTIFSGSAVMDFKNTAGFNKDGKIAMLAYYTQNGRDRQVQSMSYSLDKGRTWTIYDKNPLIDSKETWNNVNTRDPKVFWFEPGKHWVLVVNERDGQSIYNSLDGKEWKYESHTEGFWECPELFELAVDGNPSNKKWVMYGASGTYMIGSFDGRKFTPELGKFYYQKGNIYAAQTFTDAPDGRRIQIGWCTIDNPGMRFKSMMSVPTLLTLRTTPNGIRLFSEPVKEFDMLKQDVRTYSDLTPAQANEILASYPTNEPLYVKFKWTMFEATGASLALNGQNLLNYDMNHNTANGVPFTVSAIASMKMCGEVILDRTAAEVFLDSGALSLTVQRNLADENKDGLRFGGSLTKIDKLEISPLSSIWNK